jgi:hypothetical protein
MRWLIIISVAGVIGAVAGFLLALSPLLESEDHGRFITSLTILLLAMAVCACAARLLLRSPNKRIAYLGILPSIILGGILGVFASVLLLSALGADIDDIHMQIGMVLGACIGAALAIIRVRLYPKAPREEALAKLLTSLPENAGSLIKAIITKMHYRKHVQDEVMAELAAHFEDELRDCKSDEEKSQKAQKLISDFGDAKLLGILLRRAKIRCRPLWRTMVARTFQAIGILFIFFIVYVAWFLTGKPLISVDYLAQLNQMVRPVADESLNAAPLYQKATEIYGTVSDDMLTFFARNYKTIGALQYGGRFRPGIGPNDPKLADEIGIFFANRGRPDVRQEMRRKIEDEVTWRINLLLQLRYLETTVAERQFIDKWIEDQKQALDLVLAGTQKPYHWWDYGSGRSTYTIWSIRLPELNKLKMLARALSWRAWLSAEQGRYKDALGDMMTCYRFGQHHRGNRTLIEQLVGMAIEALALGNLRDILHNYEIDYHVLTRLQKDFEQTIAGEDFVVQFEVEKLSAYDAIQRCFTEDRLGGGHLSLKGFKLFRSLLGEDDYYSILLHMIDEGAWTTPLHVLFTHPNKQQTREMADRYYDFCLRMAHKTPAQMRAEDIDFENQGFEIIKGNILLEIVAPAFSKVIEFSHRIRAQVPAPITIVALLRYQNDRGVYPQSLEELMTEGYISALPMDPWSDKPLVYKRTDDDFMLYSIAENFTDDDAKVIRDEKGRTRTWTREGDAVFWPVPRPETPEERLKRLEHTSIRESELGIGKLR